MAEWIALDTAQHCSSEQKDCMNNNNVLKGYRKKEHLIGKGMFSEGSTILEGKTNKCGRGHHRCSYTDCLLNE